MLKKSFLCLTAVGFIATAAPSSAALYNDLNTYGLLGYRVTQDNPLVDQFDIGAKGFDSSTEEAIWGLAVFKIADLDSKWESFEIELGGQDFASGTFQFGLVFAGGLLGGDLLLTLNENNGVLAYEISAEKSDFRVLAADLLVKTTYSSASNVPDGGMTLVLLGGSLMGLYAIRRRA